MSCRISKHIAVWRLHCTVPMPIASNLMGAAMTECLAYLNAVPAFWMFHEKVLSTVRPSQQI